MTNHEGCSFELPQSSPMSIDISDRWRFYRFKVTEIEAVVRRTLDLATETDVSRIAQHFAMAALPPLSKSPTEKPPAPLGPHSAPVTDQQIKRALLRIERAARGVLRDKSRKSAADQLRRAINDAPREVKAALPGAVVVAALLPNTPRDRIDGLASDAAAIAATIPHSKHPGGRRPSKTDETALAILLAQSYEDLTGKTATVNNRDLGEYPAGKTSPFMLLVQLVFSAAGLPGSPRKAAERAIEHLGKANSEGNKIVNE